MRGRYTAKSLKEIDDYAYEYGIEIIPCLECYGHMEKYLMWGEAAPIKDTDSVLLAREPETFKFVEELISLPFEDYFIIVLAAMDPSYHYSRELVFITYDDGSADVFSAEGQCFGLKDNESLERSFQCDEAIFHEFLTKYTEQ